MRFGNGWATPPGAPKAPLGRRLLKISVSSFLVGALSLGMAWAGSSLVPVGASKEASKTTTTTNSADVMAEVEATQDAPAVHTPTGPLPQGAVFAGASKVNIRPRPEDYDGTWEHDMSKCKRMPGNDQNQFSDLVMNTRVRWQENPNCLYMGGFGIGPENPIVGWDDQYGLWVRSVAIGDGHDTIVLTILDGSYYFGEYNNMCNGAPATPGVDKGDQDCGFFDLQKSMGEQLGIDPSGFFFASTHAHSSMDFIGAWGGVPDWYMQQVEDSLRSAVTAAVANMRPAIAEGGEILARQFNHERRNHYRSAEESGLSWLRLIDAANQPRPATCTTPAPAPAPTTNNGSGNGFGNGGKQTPAPAPSPTCSAAQPGQAIATLGSYAAHPTTRGTNGGVGSSDFPGPFEKRLEDRFGGVGLFFQSGLGNVSSRYGTEQEGSGLADLLPAIGSGMRITGPEGSTPDIKTTQQFFDQPVTNVALGSGGVTGVFDRPMNDKPAEVSVGKDGDTPNKQCHSASPISVHTAISAARIGNLIITGGPGELFSNLTNSLKEDHPDTTVLPLSLVNDGLGYIMQSFETDHVARQAVGFVNGPLSEYEDAYSIDACFGDNVLERTLQLTNTLF